MPLIATALAHISGPQGRGRGGFPQSSSFFSPPSPNLGKGGRGVGAPRDLAPETRHVWGFRMVTRLALPH